MARSRQRLSAGQCEQVIASAGFVVRMEIDDAIDLVSKLPLRDEDSRWSAICGESLAAAFLQAMAAVETLDDALCNIDKQYAALFQMRCPAQYTTERIVWLSALKDELQERHSRVAAPEGYAYATEREVTGGVALLSDYLAVEKDPVKRARASRTKVDAAAYLAAPTLRGSARDNFIRKALADSFEAVFERPVGKNPSGPFARYASAYFQAVGENVSGGTVVAALRGPRAKKRRKRRG